jgi:hypothetical protein
MYLSPFLRVCICLLQNFLAFCQEQNLFFILGELKAMEVVWNEADGDGGYRAKHV